MFVIYKEKNTNLSWTYTKIFAYENECECIHIYTYIYMYLHTLRAHGTPLDMCILYVDIHIPTSRCPNDTCVFQYHTR